MQSLAGPFLIASVVLVLAGLRKLVDPEPTRGALRAMGLPSGRLVGFLLAVGEVFTGMLAIVDGSSLAAAGVALWYLGFSAFVAVALVRAVPLASCGCLGTPDTPPTWAHLLVDLVFAVVAVAVAVDPYGGIADALADEPAAGIPLLLWVAVGVYVTYLVLAVLPLTLQAAATVRRTRRPAGATPS